MLGSLMVGKRGRVSMKKEWKMGKEVVKVKGGKRLRVKNKRRVKDRK